MAKICTVCKHPKRGEIETALSGGTSYRDITRQFGVSRSAICRHKVHKTGPPERNVPPASEAHTGAAAAASVPIGLTSYPQWVTSPIGTKLIVHNDAEYQKAMAEMPTDPEDLYAFSRKGMNHD